MNDIKQANHKFITLAAETFAGRKFREKKRSQAPLSFANFMAKTLVTEKKVHFLREKRSRLKTNGGKSTNFFALTMLSRSNYNSVGKMSNAITSLLDP